MNAMVKKSAAAIGLELYDHWNDCFHFRRLLVKNDKVHWSNWQEWSPLHNERDSFLLIAGLRLSVQLNDREVMVFGVNLPASCLCVENLADHVNTQRAIMHAVVACAVKVHDAKIN